MPRCVRLACLLLALLPRAGYPADQQYTIRSVAGSDVVGDQGPATLAQLAGAEGVAVDAVGNVYISDNIDHRVRKVSPAGVITTVAGNGHAGFKGDGGPAAEALLRNPYGLAVDAAGSLYIADLGNGRVRRITPDGKIRTIFGDPPAVKIEPRNIALDREGAIYISDFGDHRVYRVTADGRVSLVTGTGMAGAEESGGLAWGAQVNAPAGLVVDAAGALYIADSANNRVRKVEGGRAITLMAGLAGPTGVAVDRAGNLYVADSGNRRVQKRTPGGVVSTLAAAGDLRAPWAAGLENARDVAVDAAGNVYVAGYRRVQRVSANGVVAAFAGTGAFGFLGDGGPALEAHLFFPAGLALDGAGNLYIADRDNQRVRKVTPAGGITTVAGSGILGALGDNGPAMLAQLNNPAGVAVDSSGEPWIVELHGARVRKVRRDGVIVTVAGTGQKGFLGDGGPAVAAQFLQPSAIAMDGAGTVWIADSLNHRLRKITPDGLIRTAAGNGVRGYGGDGGPAGEAQLDTPVAVAADRAGNVYIADYGNHAVRRLSPAGTIATIAGTGLPAFGGDDGPAAAAGLNHPAGVAVDGAGSVFISDSGNHRMRLVTPDGVIRTVAGDGTPGFAGDGGPALAAQLNNPAGLAADPEGNVYVADFWNHRVRKLSPAPAAASEPPPVKLAELSVVHGASMLAGPIAPGQIVTIFAARGLAESKVLFDGAPAPVFFARDDQINLQAPYRIGARKVTDVEVLDSSGVRGRATVPVAVAAPGLFTLAGGRGQVVAVDEAGGLISAANPALRGSVVVLYATGEGRVSPPAEEGRPAQPPLPRPVLPVGVSVGDYAAEVLFAGAAPGFAGLMQVNVRLPGGFLAAGSHPITLSVGGFVSQPGVMIALR